jgi:hypothetical protein
MVITMKLSFITQRNRLALVLLRIAVSLTAIIGAFFLLERHGIIGADSEKIKTIHIPQKSVSRYKDYSREEIEEMNKGVVMSNGGNPLENLFYYYPPISKEDEENKIPSAI